MIQALKEEYLQQAYPKHADYTLALSKWEQEEALCRSLGAGLKKLGSTREWRTAGRFAPVNLLSFSRTFSMLLNDPNHEGTVPVSLLLAKNTYLEVFKLRSDGGRVPVSWFAERERPSSSACRDPRLAGIDPVRRLIWIDK